MRIRVTNHIRGDEHDYDVKPEELRHFLTEHFPWVNPNQSLEDALEEIDSGQAYSAAIVGQEDVQKAEASPSTSAEVAAGMLGLDAQNEKAFAAAFWLAGKKLDRDKIRAAMWQEDGDVEKAALRAAGMDTDEESLESLRAVLKFGLLTKTDDIKENEEDVAAPKSVLPGNELATSVAAAVARGFAANDFKVVNLGGKHSTNSALVRDPEADRRYLLKPASGGVGPAAGVKEEAATQARREMAFYHIAADVFKLGDWMPAAELLLLDGREWSAMDMLPLNWRNLDKIKKVDFQRVARVLDGLRGAGILHRWAVLDYVLGNPDRHAGNLMISPEDKLKLIDHGSAFAGPDFDPGNDKSSFIPYYLRYSVSTQNFNAMDPQSQLSHMPVLNEGADADLRKWIHGLDVKRLGAELQHLGLRADACTARLELVQSVAAEDKAVAPGVNSLWLQT